MDRRYVVHRHAIDEIGDVAAMLRLGITAQRDAIAERALAVIGDVEPRHRAKDIAIGHVGTPIDRLRIDAGARGRKRARPTEDRSLRVTSAGGAGRPAESAVPAAAERDAAGAARSTGLGAGRGRSGRDGAARVGVTVTGGSDGCGSMSCACAVCPARMASRTKTQETATHLRRHMRAPAPRRKRVEVLLRRRFARGR